MPRVILSFLRDGIKTPPKVVEMHQEHIIKNQCDLVLLKCVKYQPPYFKKLLHLSKLKFHFRELSPSKNLNLPTRKVLCKTIPKMYSEVAEKDCSDNLTGGAL